jgi:hypothetical protein
MQRNFNESEIFNAASPAQKILWNSIFTRFSANPAVRQIVFTGDNIDPGGSEFLNYEARKVYLAYQVVFSYNNGGVRPDIAYVDFKDGLNNPLFSVNKCVPMWDATAAAPKYVYQTFEINNIIFWRFTTLYYNQWSFIGFRIDF